MKLKQSNVPHFFLVLLVKLLQEHLENIIQNSEAFTDFPLCLLSVFLRTTFLLLIQNEALQWCFFMLLLLNQKRVCKNSQFKGGRVITHRL